VVEVWGAVKHTIEKGKIKERPTASSTRIWGGVFVGGLTQRAAFHKTEKKRMTNGPPRGNETGEEGGQRVAEGG